jgi:antitoxin ParD1/3/4
LESTTTLNIVKIRKQISKEQQRQQLRDLLLAGAQSSPTAPVDSAHFDAMRKRIHRRESKSGSKS